MNDIRTRPVSIAHLVFGLIFLGAAGLWAVGAATEADTPDLAVLAPGILIAAGVVGLIAMVINARNARVQVQGEESPASDRTDTPPTADTTTDTTDTTDTDTVVIDGEDHR
jgi:hypothetical protein